MASITKRRLPPSLDRHVPPNSTILVEMEGKIHDTVVGRVNVVGWSMANHLRTSLWIEMAGLPHFDIVDIFNTLRKGTDDRLAVQHSGPTTQPTWCTTQTRDRSLRQSTGETSIRGQGIDGSRHSG
jgi:hypothetical protein